MLVSDEHVIEEPEVTEHEVHNDDPDVCLRYNHTDPDVISDGVDGIDVIQEEEDVYRVDYWGYAFGRLLVHPAGVEELGQEYLATDAEIPSWTLDSETVDEGDLPWWVPDDVDPDPTTTCQRCREAVSVQNVVTPSRPGFEDERVFCRECWEERR